MTKRNLRSEVALQEACDSWEFIKAVACEERPVIELVDVREEDEVVAEIDLLEVISKRQSLKGVSKRIAKALRTPAKKVKAKRG